MKYILSRIRREHGDMCILMRSIPAPVVTLFVVSVICMNLLANKTLLQLPWIALDGGILISWLSFMCMDIITKHFGPGASNRISVLACGINLLTCLIFFIAAAIPSNAGDYAAFDGTFGEIPTANWPTPCGPTSPPSSGNFSITSCSLSSSLPSSHPSFGTVFIGRFSSAPCAP